MENALQNLSEEELLSEIVPKESAAYLIKEFSSIYNLMTHTTEEQIKAVPGIGKAKARKVGLVREMMRRIEQGRQKTTMQISSSSAVEAYFSFLKDAQKEELWILLLNTKNRIITSKCVSIGTVNMSLAQPREVFSEAVKYMASSIILVHNHPSGNPAPSPEDDNVTRQMIEAGNLLRIEVLDHVIIGKNGSYSYSMNRGDLWR